MAAGTSDALPFRNIAVVVCHVLMVVVGRIEVTEHGDCLNLGPPTPTSNHVNRPTFVLDPMLTPATSKRVGPVQCPRLVPEILEVGRECTAEDTAGLAGGSENYARLQRCKKSSQRVHPA